MNPVSTSHTSGGSRSESSSRSDKGCGDSELHGSSFDQVNLFDRSDGQAASGVRELFLHVLCTILHKAVLTLSVEAGARKDRERANSSSNVIGLDDGRTLSEGSDFVSSIFTSAAFSWWTALLRGTAASMNATEWVYLGEGGKHAIFAFRGEQEEWKERVLRISKVDLARSASTEIVRRDAETDSLPYVRDVVSPFLTPYLDVPEVIQLDWTFVALLREEALVKELVPPSRRSGWFLSQVEAISSHATAHLLWNYRIMRNPRSTGPCFCVEIKPKAGYTAFSPLVHPERRVKYEYTRFVIMQQLHCNGYITKSWTCNQTREVSLYDPLDLFSSDAKRLRRALDHLAHAPQNNLKVWVDDTPLVGANISLPASYENDLCEFTCRQGTGSGDFITNGLECATQILVEEALLAKLLRLQRLDVVDADGAMLIYERLVELCGDEADCMLDSPCRLKPCIDSRDGDSVLSGSPFNKPSECASLGRLLHEIECFAFRLNDSIVSLNDMNKALESAKSHVKTLSRDACVYLLKNWLLSLAMCDVSIFLVLNPVGGNDAVDEGVETADLRRCTDRKFAISCQTETNQGLLVRSVDASQSSDAPREAAFAYTLKLVDYDMKQANKLHNRKAKEETIKFYRTQTEAEGT